MGSIRGVMLLPLDSAGYRQRLAYHTFLNRVNAGETTPDFRTPLTRCVEDRVREQLDRMLPTTRYRVLRWEGTGPTQRMQVQYRELDGVYKTAGGATVLLEVKASASKGSLVSGLRQLRAAVKTLSAVQPRTVGLLVVADLGALVEGFGDAVTWPVSDYFVGREVTLLDWPPRVPEVTGGQIFVAVIPEIEVEEWVGGMLEVEAA